MADNLKKILLVDDNRTNLNDGQAALSGHYAVYLAPSAPKMFNLLNRVIPDLILLDVEMPEIGGYEAIKILKADDRTAHIPVIFLTAKNSIENELEGLTLGAVDYITKPFSHPLLLKRIERHLKLEDYHHNLQSMVDEKTSVILDLQAAVFELLAEVVEYRDDVTGGHVARTQRYIGLMLEEMRRRGLYSDQIEGWDFTLIQLSSQLHDLGKVAIRDSILLKPGRLTAEEFEEMKKHTTLGAKIIARIEGAKDRAFVAHAKLMARSHHERWDGKGYPDGLREEEVPLEGRIMAFADVYDALISQRPYKSSSTHEEAVEIISQGRGTQFDPFLMDIFLSIVDFWPDRPELRVVDAGPEPTPVAPAAGEAKSGS
ncbi:MAG: response regulator [Deltaproteobacteria bacterium]|jgi:putative two-component system response regulator|nr:response regulator [Deltaproteobacteria bacterium]